MSLITLDPEIQPTVRSCQEYQSLPVRFTFPEVTVGHRPGWALGSSFILHELAICAIVLLSLVHFPSQTVLVRSTKVTDADHIVYLPVLGGGAEGNGHEGGLSGRFQKSSAPVPARASKGFSYPGPQPILSDPPSPDRINQTLLQPHLRKPPALPELVALPNIVHMANAEPAPLDVRKNRSVPSAVPKLIEPPKLKLPSTKLKLMPTQPDLPEFNPAEVDSRQIPKLALPVNAPQQPEPIKVQPEHASKIARKAIEPPKPDQFVTKSTRGKDLQTLVALSPMPALPGPALKIPAAEARASFGVSPLSNMKIVQGGPGSKTAGAPSALASIGIRTTAASGNRVDEIVVGAGNGSAGSMPGGAGGTGAGQGSHVGPGHGGTGSEAGHGSETGMGLGSGSGITVGSGMGAANGRGSGGLAGITIQGASGSYNSTIVGNVQGGVSLPRQTAYGVRVSSLGNSGGGLADYSVFSDEKVYTVYLDMRKTLDDPAPSWTLQYAVLRPPNDPSPTSELTPPFPATKEIPKLSPEVLVRYSGRVVVVYGMIDSQGKFQELTVKDSPDDQLDVPIIVALRKWSFRPAELNGQPIAIKVLLGITLSPE